MTGLDQTFFFTQRSSVLSASSLPSSLVSSFSSSFLPSAIPPEQLFRCLPSCPSLVQRNHLTPRVGRVYCGDLILRRLHLLSPSYTLLPSPYFAQSEPGTSTTSDRLEPSPHLISSSVPTVSILPSLFPAPPWMGLPLLPLPMTPSHTSVLPHDETSVSYCTALLTAGPLCPKGSLSPRMIPARRHGIALPRHHAHHGPPVRKRIHPVKRN